MKTPVPTPSGSVRAGGKPAAKPDIRFPEAKALEAELRRAICGEVRFDNGTRAIYSTDSSNYRQMPIGVVIPKSKEDVEASVAVCRRFDAPLLSRGGGTSLAGQCCNTAVIVDFSKYLNRVLYLDREGKLARVEPGTILDDLRNLGESRDPRLTFGPTPSTHDHCTIGGMIGNNACGNYSIMSEFYGAGPRMAHNVAEMEVLTYDGLRMRVGPTTDAELERIVAGGSRRGEIYRKLRELRDRYADLIRARFPDFPRRVSGYNLDGLLPEMGFNLAYALVGTESTCVTVLDATLRMVDSPPARSLVLVGFEDIYAAAAQMVAAREHKPIALEGFDEVLIDDNKKLGIHTEELQMLPSGKGWMLAEFAAETKQASDAMAMGLVANMRKATGYVDEKLYDDPAAEAKIWEVRESGLGATAFVPGEPDTYEGWEDSAVPPENLAGYLRDLRQLFNKYDYACALYGHFGQGCVHTRIDWDPHTAEGIEKFRRFLDEASDLVLRNGGSLSGEHGDGQSRAELLPKMYGEEIVQAFREFKSIWDPAWKMNPGKVVDPYRITENLRLGVDYGPPSVKTHFSYPQDGGSFAHATLRCVGVGKCRRLSGGTMCPSFMATREEKHTTRGRARILFEMMNGAEIDLWKSDEVLEALDLCLSCKGCKKDCPVSVDMATYKAEFLSHYYEGRLRPRVAYAMGLIYWWARIASKMPRVANFVTHGPFIGAALKVAAGIAPQRDAPTFATESFKDWFRRREPRSRGGPEVLLWPDTFNNYLHPDTAKATVEVLEAAGYRVVVPEASLCCGRPLYDYGMLDLAERLLRQILETLRPHIQAGLPVIGMEPSCMAVFRDELPSLFPHDEDAKRLSRSSFLLSEFLLQRAERWQAPTLRRTAIVHGHCHHKSVMGFDAERQVLERLGLECEVLDSGCCGMAGSFGFEKGQKYEVAQKSGERVLLPRVREAPKDTLVLADGFSCRTMIEQNTDRRALHLAQVIQMAMREGPTGSVRLYPEAQYVDVGPDGHRKRPMLRLAAVAVGASAAGGAVVWGLRRKR
jgi:FAD/FMN-containing dehydrogenase/Fe-S oxidoreductase